MPRPPQIRTKPLIAGPVTRRTVLKAGGTLLLSVMPALPAAAAQILAVRVWPADDYTRVTLDGRAVQVIHFDLYRMSSPEEFLDAGFREDFNGDNICIVEWPDKAAPVLPPPDVLVHLNVAGSGRDVELQALSDLGLLCLDRLTFAPPPSR